MSLFDVIKYPVGDYPTEEVLRNLPEKIFNKWINSSKFVNGYTTNINHQSSGAAADVANWYSRFYDTQWFGTRDAVDIRFLRKLIREYEE